MFVVAVAVGWLHAEQKLVSVLVLQRFNFTLMSGNSLPTLQLSFHHLINLSLHPTDFNNCLFEYFLKLPTADNVSKFEFKFKVNTLTSRRKFNYSHGEKDPSLLDLFSQVSTYDVKKKDKRLTIAKTLHE